MKEKQNARVLSQKEIAPGIFDLWVETKSGNEGSSRTVYLYLSEESEHASSKTHQYLRGQ